MPQPKKPVTIENFIEVVNWAAKQKGGPFFLGFATTDEEAAEEFKDGADAVVMLLKTPEEPDKK